MSDDASDAPRPTYTGQQTNCTGCGLEFKPGDKILANLERDLTFCRINPDDLSNCISRWVNENLIDIPDDGIAFDEMIFPGPAEKLPENGGPKLSCDCCE